MNQKTLKNTLMLLAVLAAAGCTKTTIVPVATEPDVVGMRLAGASEKAAQALDTISGIEQQKTQITPPQNDFSDAPPQLQEVISVRWSGPIEQITQTLAQRAGMKMRVMGSRPAAPVTVHVDVYQKPMIELLRDIGLQAGRRADLKLDSISGVIEIRYAPADRL